MAMNREEIRQFNRDLEAWGEEYVRELLEEGRFDKSQRTFAEAFLTRRADEYARVMQLEEMGWEAVQVALEDRERREAEKRTDVLFGVFLVGMVLVILWLLPKVF